VLLVPIIYGSTELIVEIIIYEETKKRPNFWLMVKVDQETLFTKLLPCICPGEYVALVGARLDGAEMLLCGLATHFVPSNKLLLLEESLKKIDTSNTLSVCRIIDQFAEQPSLKENTSLNRLEIIKMFFQKDS